jgi:deazaflavin-dependent oxidoreductase (nitroreductase family)
MTHYPPIAAFALCGRWCNGPGSGGGGVDAPLREFIMKLLTSAFIALNVWLYRVSGGRMMGKMGAAPILLLTTTGRRSRRERTVPVLYLEDGGRFVIVASLAAAPRHPAWFLNLEANPRVGQSPKASRPRAQEASASIKAAYCQRMLSR